MELPDFVSGGEIKVYDNLGRVVRVQAISESQVTINTSDLTTGSYMVVVRTDYGNATKTLIVE
ncbi:T9SS type A sorting domain-containing protein [Flavobacterium lindanitolerans]|nr:T9SS type A sorting domain-containing protein [Flavobacterium lindanitolerans]